LLRINPFLRVAFEPGHFAVLLSGEPFLKLLRTRGRSGGGETAAVEA
jgi:hypothetical protein